MGYSARRLAGVLWLVCVLAWSTAAATAATGPVVSVPASFVLTGHGLGHGIGLSQWGAQGRAAAGESLSQILASYYPHTALKPAGDAAAAPVRVLVAQAPTFKVGASGTFTARDAHGQTVTLSGMHQATLDTLGSTDLTFPLTLAPTGHPLRVGGLAYAGDVRIVHRGQALLAINVVAVEDYVRGVVSTESPGYWRPAALQAQAVAARSYVLAHRHAHADFDVFPDDRSQNYRGLARNFASSGNAASATAGQVLVYRGRIANAMFSASNGGLTSAGAEPYLVSKRDPFDARSPAADWGPVSVSPARLAAVFPELRAPVESLSFIYNGSDRVSHVTLTLADGSRKRLSGFEFQQRLGLRSTYFTAGATLS
jgi:stage II sporulation protein D